MDKRAVVIVTKAHGDKEISDAVIRGVVSREMKLIQAERDLMRLRRREVMQAKIDAANEMFAVKPESRIRGWFEQAMALIALLIDWGREQRARA